jgi:hypothetical protein
MQDRIEDAHRHRNAEGDSYTHDHPHDVEHCEADCDKHEPASLNQADGRERRPAAFVTR